ncbi:MAG: methylcrotonoyl-CoA carboxylase [Caulobacteraceae bacterium]|nr:methylcrotonoyl-CoA carboxylase [Caulobacteraceae bacterium]
MIGKLLVANRGEIARRVIRTARRMGVASVAVYSEADAHARHVAEADEAKPIGPAAALQSYLNGAAILGAARATGAEAIHPGYGFLSENADFAEAVIEAGLIWVGPPPSAIRAMGLKDEAKRLMAAAGAPVTPGYLGEDQSDARLRREAEAIGWPVLIKAIAGGGGKGIRKVERKADFAAALASARREAAAAFGDDRVLLESFATKARHLEVQVFGDAAGNVVHLFERDCSLQRRRQKLAEEAPAPGLSAESRAWLCDVAVRAAKAVGYQNAGTVEFLADASDGLRTDRIWFMEMNTRLQVEHPVTEAITGLDLVEWQLRIAAGEPLPLRQEEITMTGWAVEARLYAEDPAAGFAPSAGPLGHLLLPAGIRIDAGVEAGGEVATHYDPMIAKLTAHGTDRQSALARLSGALGAVEAWPVKTNAGFLARLLADTEVREGRVDTGLIERVPELTVRPRPSDEALTAAAWALASDGADRGPWSAAPLAGFRLGAEPAPALIQQGEDVFAAPFADRRRPSLRVGDDCAVVFEAGEAYPFARPRSADAGEASAGGGMILAPMPGRVVEVGVKAGDAVRRGGSLVVIEAMKMEQSLPAPFDAVVAEVAVAAGEQVAEGALLMRLTAKD